MSHPTLFPILPSEKPPKKPWLLGCVVVGVLLTMGFFAGRGYQDMKNGYHFSVQDDKSFPFMNGEIHLKHVYEYVGFELMVTGKTLIEYTGLGTGVTLYKAQQCFQESTPVAKNLQVDGNTLRWDDGEVRYKLEMEAMPPEKAPEEQPDKGVTISSTK